MIDLNRKIAIDWPTCFCHVVCTLAFIIWTVESSGSIGPEAVLFFACLPIAFFARVAQLWAGCGFRSSRAYHFRLPFCSEPSLPRSWHFYSTYSYLFRCRYPMRLSSQSH